MTALETLLRPTLNALAAVTGVGLGSPEDFTVSDITYDNVNGSDRVNLKALSTKGAIKITYYTDELYEQHDPVRDLFIENDVWSTGQYPWIHIVRIDNILLHAALQEVIPADPNTACFGLIDHLGNNLVDQNANCISP